ncbi:MAG: DUF4189 domain-containing protein [Xanthobacteraceae bacterium]
MSATARRIAGALTLVAMVSFGGSAPAQNRLPVDPTADYGSIAYSPTDGRSGYSYNYRSEGEAVQVAMGYCRQDGGKACRTVVWVSNGCGAVAIAGSNRNFVAANGKYQPEAESTALSLCQQSYGRSCTIKVWVCTSP